MIFVPMNKMLLVELAEIPASGENVDDGVVLVDNEEKAPDKYSVVRLLSAAQDSTLAHRNIATGTLLVVLTHLLESVKVQDDEFYTVPEGAVIALIVNKRSLNNGG